MPGFPSLVLLVWCLHDSAWVTGNWGNLTLWVLCLVFAVTKESWIHLTKLGQEEGESTDWRKELTHSPRKYDPHQILGVLNICDRFYYCSKLFTLPQQKTIHPYFLPSDFTVPSIKVGGVKILASPTLRLTILFALTNGTLVPVTWAGALNVLAGHHLSSCTICHENSFLQEATDPTGRHMKLTWAQPAGRSRTTPANLHTCGWE